MSARRTLRAVLSVLAAITVLLGLSAVPAAAAADTGSVAGTFLRGPGRPLDAVVRLRNLTGSEVASASTDAEGRFRLPEVPVGEYRLVFSGPGKAVQYWPRQAQEDQAGIVTVTAGGTAVVEETALPLGELEITATDRATGAPLPNALVLSREGPYPIWAHTDAAGVARFGPVRAGTWALTVSAQGYVKDHFDAVVRAEETTRLTRPVVTAPSIAVEFTSAATGAAVGNACVHAAPAANPALRSSDLKCANGNGQLRLTGLAPGRYRLFAVPGTMSGGDGVHGSQWVGADGGTGDPLQAKEFVLDNGDSAAVRVRFDRAGSITGAVTDAVSGTPVAELCPTVTPAYPQNHLPWNVRCTGADGRYAISDLGPYDWRVQFPDLTGVYAWQWSGSKPDRLSATPVRVVAGAATTLAAGLRPAGSVSGRITGNTIPFWAASVEDYHAGSGDPAGPAGRIQSDGRYTLSGLDTQQVRIRFRASGFWQWHPDPVQVTAGHPREGVDLRVTSAG